MTTIPDSDAIDAANTRYMDAFAKRDIDALLGMYTNDAVVLQPDRSQYAGRESIRGWLAVFLNNTPDGESLDLQSASLFRLGD